MGNALVALKHDDAALKEFADAIAMQPNDLLALKNIGLIYGRQGKFDVAMQYLERARTLAPRDAEVNLALAEAQIGEEAREQILHRNAAAMLARAAKTAQREKTAA